MIRLTIFVTVIAGGLYLATFYKLGDKPLAGHLSDIYRSPVVQEKLRDLSSGVDKRVHHIEHEAEKSLPKKSEPHVRRQSAQLEPQERPESEHRVVGHASAVEQVIKERAAPEHSAPERMPPDHPVGVRVATEHTPTENQATMHAERPQPAHDQLTDDDRTSLDHLLAKKLNK